MHKLGVEKVTNFMKGTVLLICLIVFLIVAILLREKGIYDYRSREEQWNEKVNKGYYSRYQDEEVTE